MTREWLKTGWPGKASPRRWYFSYKLEQGNGGLLLTLVGLSVSRIGCGFPGRVTIPTHCSDSNSPGTSCPSRIQSFTPRAPNSISLVFISNPVFSGLETQDLSLSNILWMKYIVGFCFGRQSESFHFNRYFFCWCSLIIRYIVWTYYFGFLAINVLCL